MTEGLISDLSPTMMGDADLILVMDAGQIVEQGTGCTHRAQDPAGHGPKMFPDHTISACRRSSYSYGMRKHEHTKGEDDASGRGGYVGFIDWLNRKLVPILGMRDLGPYETVVKQVGEAVCPVCGRPISEHFIDHSTPETILNCPVEHKPEPVDNAPLNELGMDKPSAES